MMMIVHIISNAACSTTSDIGCSGLLELQQTLRTLRASLLDNSTETNKLQCARSSNRRDSFRATRCCSALGGGNKRRIIADRDVEQRRGAVEQSCDEMRAIRAES